MPVNLTLVSSILPLKWVAQRINACLVVTINSKIKEIIRLRQPVRVRTAYLPIAQLTSLRITLRVGVGVQHSFKFIILMVVLSLVKHCTAELGLRRAISRNSSSIEHWANEIPGRSKSPSIRER